MPKYARGVFAPKNPAKYIGAKAPIFRSGWELHMMMFFDSNKHILYWASEAIVIPYLHPLTGKRANYIPDFFITYNDGKGKHRAEIIEVKPKKQTSVMEAKSKHDKLHAVVNMAKFAAATAYCKQHGYVFRVVSEDVIFHQGKR